MPCIWGQHNKAQLFIPIVILPVAPGSTAPQANISGAYAFNALIDTGAQGTCISPNVANVVGLQPLGKTQIFGVSGAQFHNYYMFFVGFPLGPFSPSTQQFQGRIDIFTRPIQGAELAIGQGGFDVLLGMDVLGTGSLAVEGSGTYSLSF